MNNGVLGMVRQWQSFLRRALFQHDAGKKTDFVKLPRPSSPRRESRVGSRVDRSLEAAFAADRPF